MPNWPTDRPVEGKEEKKKLCTVSVCMACSSKSAFKSMVSERERERMEKEIQISSIYFNGEKQKFNFNHNWTAHKASFLNINHCKCRFSIHSACAQWKIHQGHFYLYDALHSTQIRDAQIYSDVHFPPAEVMSRVNLMHVITIRAHKTLLEIQKEEIAGKLQ